MSWRSATLSFFHSFTLDSDFAVLLDGNGASSRYTSACFALVSSRLIAKLENVFFFPSLLRFTERGGRMEISGDYSQNTEEGCEAFVRPFPKESRAVKTQQQAR